MALSLPILNQYTNEEVQSYSAIDLVEMDKIAKKATYIIKSFDTKEVRNAAKTNTTVLPFVSEEISVIDFDSFYTDSINLDPYAAAYIDAKKSRLKEKVEYVENELKEMEQVITQYESNKWVNAQDC